MVCQKAIEMFQRHTPDPPDVFMDSGWLYEGNFDEWLSKTYPRLCLTAEVSPLRHHFVFQSQSHANQYQTSSIQATVSILSMVWRDMLLRQELEGCRTVLDLLRQLEKGCSAFRFLGLPLELREIIYDLVLDIPKHSASYRDGFRYYFRSLAPKVNRVMALRITEPKPCRTRNPLLLGVNRQMRSETGKVYFGRNQFDIWIDNEYCACSLEAVKVLLKTMVAEFVTHLRVVRVHAGCQAMKKLFVGTAVQLVFDQSQGLQITGWDESWDVEDQDAPPKDQSFFDMPSYVAILEKNRIAHGQRGEVIVDFFADSVALCQAWCGRDQRTQLLNKNDPFDSAEDAWAEYNHDWRFGLFHGYDSSMKRSPTKVRDLRKYRCDHWNDHYHCPWN